MSIKNERSLNRGSFRFLGINLIHQWLTTTRWLLTVPSLWQMLKK